ncbi:MAG: 2-dehydropantoate 2-reductase [Thaumarchaeota archaeon]|nr:2-dehydropantoate 2-reductase [Nitrososphaerota archaeon]
MKISIIGAGALGCLFAGLLTEAKEDVTLISHTPEQARVIRKRGVKITNSSGIRTVCVNALSEPKAEHLPDLILIAVKAYDTDSAARTAATIRKPDTIVLTLQNGLGNVETLAEYIPPRNIAQGVTIQASTLLDIGSVYHAAAGLTVIGSWNRDILASLEDVKKVFNSASIPTEVTSRIDVAVWRKLLVNIAINPVSALTGVRNGDLLRFEEVMLVMKEAVSEAARVAQTVGVKLPDQDAFYDVFVAAKETARNKSSMLQDLQRGKETEIDYLNGGIVMLGRKHGVPTPVNEALAQAVNRRSDTSMLRFLEPKELLRFLPAKPIRTA